MKKLYLFFSFSICLNFISAQVGIHGDVTLEENTTVGIFGSSLEFVNGRIESTTNNPARVYISEGTAWNNASHSSYIGTEVEIEEREDFIFPVGDGGQFHAMAVHSTNNANVVTSYINGAHTNKELAPRMEKIAPFYWQVGAQSPMVISLTWDAESSITQLTNAVDALVILGFNGQRWEEISATVRAQDLLSSTAPSLTIGSITSDASVDLNTYESFSIGSKIYRAGIKISDAFSPNGDGKNDVRYIQYAEQYPSMKIKIFNRWGEPVFTTNSGYQNNWNGTYKNNSKKLPSTSYLYQIDLEGDGNIDHQGWVFIQH